MRINRHDTNGTKPLLGKGELGYDDYTAGGDTGRIYVGTGVENIPLAKRLESNMMTKAQFHALAEERKANRAGSGFEEWGKHITTSSSVNEGIIQFNTLSNKFGIGFSAAPSSSFSKTWYPVLNINGVKQNLIGLYTDSFIDRNIITLPTAPTIYPHDTVLTPEQIASGVIKHADSSNSGLIVNGKFDTDTSGWGANASVNSSESGKLKITTTDTAGGAFQIIPTIIGKKYIVECVAKNITSADVRIRVTPSYDFTTTADSNINNTTAVSTLKVEFIANGTSMRVYLRVNGTNKEAEFDNIAVYPADAISRSDLAFLESWHEDISEKNFVYPLGNVQYLGGNVDGLTGITNGAFTGFETYSLFGNWQTPSTLIGKGYIWSSLTEAQKRAFIANPENNCYLDGDKTIQVRYRVRAVQGWGDDWLTVFNSSLTSSIYSSTARLASQGKVVLPTALDSGNPAGRYVNSYFQGSILASNSGLWNEATQINGHTGTTVVATPIAIVHRRNQGIYHPVYNANGSKKASDGNFWYNTAVSFTSISDCFDPAKLLTASGYIGTVSGRPDGLFYDQVHEGDILDLRNSSKKSADKSRLISREFNKLVAGTYRGKEGEWITQKAYVVSVTSSSSSDAYFGATSHTRVIGTISSNIQQSFLGVSPDMVAFIVDSVGNYYKILTIYINQIHIASEHGNVTASFVGGQSYEIYISQKSTRTKSNTLLHCDIIGNPTNYPTAWKESGVFGTPLIVAEDGTSLLPNGTLDTFKLSRKANATPLLCLRSTDNGATWVSFTPTFSTTTNAITLTDEPASNLVIVYYQTKTTMAVPAVNSEVLEIGEVIGTNGLANGALVSTLIGKVPTANTAPYSQRGYSVSGYRIDMSTFKFSTTSTELPVHSVLSLAGGAAGVPAVKVLPYLTKRNGKAYLSLIFKEMKHNGTSWGDDSKFNIVDNISTTPDQNAKNILYGTKEVELNMFVGADK